VPDPNDKFDFDDLKLPDQMPLEPMPDVESLGEMAPAGAVPAEETTAAAPVPPAEPSAASEPAEEGKKGKKKGKKKEKAKKTGKPPKASSSEEKSGVEEKEKSPGILQRLAKASPYTLMLFGAAVFLLIAVLIMIGELWRYHLDVNAKEAKERISMRLSLDRIEIDRLRG
jgi:hypothetical protein